jgi:hypothetical protein
LGIVRLIPQSGIIPNPPLVLVRIGEMRATILTKVMRNPMRRRIEMRF